MRSVVFVALFLIIGSTAHGQVSMRSGVGVVNSLPNSGACLAIRNSRLSTGDKIRVVLPDKPQSTFVATVSQRTNANCSSKNDVFENGSFYLLKVPRRVSPFDGFGIAGPVRVRIVRGIAQADLNNDRKLEYFRSCTSAEGIHLTIWTGKPFSGKRIWHAYYYLGYDTEPTCKGKETADSSR